MTVHVRKKRKIERTVTEEALKCVVHEVDLEIGIRRRLAEAVEARITWAGLLQESLRNGRENSSTLFKGAAIEALDAIETPLNPIFLREPFPPSWVPRPLPVHRDRPLPTYKPPPKPSTKPSFLFIRTPFLDSVNPDAPIRTYLLRCPQCLRITFTSLQGLLNHARISHKLEWGTHDDCVRACAVVEPELDINAGFEVGLGPQGLLPGLRSLFKMAVGESEEAGTTPIETDAQNAPETSATSSSSHLNRTLGLHEDSPALAPFLGKQTSRRGIKVCDEGLVDVDTQDMTLKPKGPWRMHYSQRNNMHPIQTEVTQLLQCEDTEELRQNSRVTPIVPKAEVMPATPQEGSRFHFSTRVIIMDRSLWIPPAKRAGSEATHKWMVSVDSPSYSHHISTVLDKMTVSPLSGDPFPAKDVVQPPFVIIGRTSQPFLARIELSFIPVMTDSGPTPQNVVLEHWVELDLERNNHPAAGDEQVVDVELDRCTSLRPMLKDYTPIGSKSLWNDDWDTAATDLREVTEVQMYERMLLQLLEKYPMTRKDLDRRQPPPGLPYMLATTPHQFKNMVIGRRKAIEWGRASAIQSAYSKVAEEPIQASQTLPKLSVGDVYRWLSDGGHFLRAPSQDLSRSNFKKGGSENPEQQRNWCPTCGRLIQPSEEARIIKAENSEASTSLVKQESEEVTLPSYPNPRTCQCSEDTIQTKLPMVNVKRRLHVFSDAELSRHLRPTINLQNDGRVVTKADPRLTLAVREIVHSLHLPRVPLSGTNIFPLDQLGSDSSAVHTTLAPHALMALTLKPFIRELVKGGLEYSSKQREEMGLGSRKKRTTRKGADRGFDLLTPTQVLNGVSTRAREAREGRGDVKHIAMYELLTRLGTPVEDSGVNEEDGESGHLLKGHGSRVKSEPRDT